MNSVGDRTAEARNGLVIDAIDGRFQSSPGVPHLVGVHAYRYAVLIHGHMKHAARALRDAYGRVRCEFLVGSAGLVASHRR